MLMTLESDLLLVLLNKRMLFEIIFVKQTRFSVFIHFAFNH